MVLYHQFLLKNLIRQIQKACRMQALQTDQKSEEVRLRSDGIPDEGKQLLMLRLKKNACLLLPRWIPAPTEHPGQDENVRARGRGGQG